MNTYNEGLKNLAAMGIDLNTVESVSRLGISKYQKLNEPFYNCFDKNTVYLKRYKPVKIADNANLNKIYDIIKAMSSAMLMMLHFSAGGSYRLFEMSYFNMDNKGTIMKLYQPDDGKAYLHIVSAYSKNKKLEPRVLLVNDEVTKYFIHFIHFILALYPLVTHVQEDEAALKEAIDHAQQTEVNVIDIGNRVLQDESAIADLNTAIGDQQEGLNATKNELRQLVDRLNVMESIKLV